MLTLDPTYLQLAHQTRLREAARRHEIELARAAQAEPPRWLAPLLLPRVRRPRAEPRTRAA
jgi:hypothetical protein